MGKFTPDADSPSTTMLRFIQYLLFVIYRVFIITQYYTKLRIINKMVMRFYIPKTLYFYSIPKNCNHKRLGLYYLILSLLFGISGILLSIIIRLELYSSGNRIINKENINYYNLSITLHGLLMIFFIIMPGLYGGRDNR